MGILDFCCTLEAAIDAHQSIGPSVTEVDPSIETVDPTHPEAGLSVDSEISTLLDLVGESWAEQVSEQDPRFRGLVPAGHGTVFDRIDELTAAAGVTDLPTARALLDAIPALKSKVRDLDRLTLDAALRDLVAGLTKYSGSRVDALIARLNWGGASNGTTLEEGATSLGITRERMRQLQLKVDLNLPKHPVFMPALDRAVRYLESVAPIDADTAANSLSDAGITGDRFHPASVLAAARGLGHKHSLTIRPLAGRQMLVAELDVAVSVRIINVADRLLSESGATSISSLLEELTDESINTTAATIRDILVKCGEYRFLEGDWFGRPNRSSDFVYRNTRRMLAVVTDMDVGLLRDGLGRAFRFRHSTRRQRRWASVPPPRSVLVEYYRAHAEFVISSEGRVRSAEILDIATDLAPAERMIVEVLRASPLGVMDRSELTEQCVARGVNTSSVWLLCSYSPVVVRVSNGLWALRGVRVDPSAVEELRRARALRPREDRITDHGWTAEGRLWFAYRLPQFPDNAVIFVPAPIRRYLAGKSFSRGQGEPGVSIGDDGLVAGYKVYLRGTGADEDDVIIFSFELMSESVILRLDSRDYLEQTDASYAEPRD
jgi:hypothetical protein